MKAPVSISRHISTCQTVIGTYRRSTAHSLGHTAQEREFVLERLEQMRDFLDWCQRHEARIRGLRDGAP